MQSVLIRIFAVLLILLPSTLRAQKYELGLFGGGANYLGDISPHIYFKTTRPAYGLFGKVNMSKHFAFRLGYSRLEIAGTDANNKAMAARNLSFRTPINEFSGIIEFNYLPYMLGILSENMTTYVFCGIGYFNYEPYANYRGSDVKLRPLKTEGQLKPYSKYSLSIPFGMGYKYSLSKVWVASAELGYRFSFSDYLDDVSYKYPDLTKMDPLSAALSDRSSEIGADAAISSPGDMRGNERIKDWYMAATISIAYRFRPSSCYRF